MPLTTELAEPSCPTTEGANATTRILVCADDMVDGTELQESLAPASEVEIALGECDLTAIPNMTFESEPDVLILDTDPPGIDVKLIIKQILQRYPNVRIIALSASSLPKDIVKLIAAGALAYLPRHPKIGELRDAVDTVLGNRVYISQRLTDNASPGCENTCSSVRPTGSETLTARERDVLKLLADGYTSRKIASSLGISEKTVESHRGNIKAKLGLGSIAELTKFAIRHKITSLGV